MLSSRSLAQAFHMSLAKFERERERKKTHEVCRSRVGTGISLLTYTIGQSKFQDSKLEK